jgi:uncharacterized protein (DUF169 family)
MNLEDVHRNTKKIVDLLRLRTSTFVIKMLKDETEIPSDEKDSKKTWDIIFISVKAFIGCLN